ncbi:MAG: hypothetical protein LBS50_07005 [Prevotellaceae bacterium]|jgi:hypothetical protein|nr:hypothetical protein [Prevotellaceae bacterium]
MSHNFNFDSASPIIPFQVPDGYFEDFVVRMEQKINPVPVKIPLWQKTKPYFYAAAMFASIIVMGTLFVKKDSTKILPQTAVYDEATDEIMLETIDENVIIDYLLANTDTKNIKIKY